MSRFLTILHKESTQMHTSTFNETATSLRVGKSKTDFLLSELAQILEANHVVVSGIQLLSSHTDFVEVHIELEGQDLRHLLPTLRRYGYVILSEHQEDEWLEKLQSNASYLEKYLSI